jgi:hypothetical protein
MAVPALSVWLFRIAVTSDPSAGWLMGFIIIVPPLTSVMFSCGFILLGIVWHFVNNKMLNCAIFIVLSAICGLVDYSAAVSLPYPINCIYQLFVGSQWLMILAAPFILFCANFSDAKCGDSTRFASEVGIESAKKYISLHNGVRGRSCKYLFYLYCPMRQYALLLLSNLFV